ncbi:MAG: glycosyltransferase family 2 protein [Deferrisomatales bacterium]|nr:glycosyltransferase family 2 protein [Deferrisomatales bacterium]
MAERGWSALDPEPRVAVVILTVNQREKTLRVLGSFSPEERRRHRFLVWDNGSKDGTGEAVALAFPEVAVQGHGTNLGVASGRNAAAALAVERFAPTHLLFLDNDMVVTEGFVEALLAPFGRDPLLGQTQAKLRFLKDPERLNDGGGCRITFWRGRTHPVGFGELDRGQRDREAPCIACGGAMMVRADVFRELGGFDSAFDPFGPEDLDFSLRLQGRGYRALYVPRAVAYHEVGHTFGGGRYSGAYARAKARHWLRFLTRHGKPHQVAAFFLLGAPWAAARLVLREGRKGNLGAVAGTLRGALESLFRR